MKYVSMFAPEERLRARMDVLEVLVRHPRILQRASFEALKEALVHFVPFAALGIIVPEEEGARRVYALSRGADDTLAFGTRIVDASAIYNVVYQQKRPYLCDDTRAGKGIEQTAYVKGILSYCLVPIHAPDSERVIADLVFGFAEVGAAGRAPIDFLQEIADSIGLGLAENLRLARDHRLAMILETSWDAMIAWDRDGRITDANAAAELLTGRPRDVLLGTPVASILGPLPDGRSVLDLAGASPMRRTPTQGVRLELRIRCPSRDAERKVVVAATITPVDDDARVAAHALLRDLTTIAEAEAEAAARLRRIHELEEQHRTLLDNAPLIIFRLDPKSAELVYLNRCAERLLGVPTKEALETPGFLRSAHVDPEGILGFDNALEAARSGGVSSSYEARLLCRGGDDITARGTLYPLLSEQGELVAIEGVLVDVSAEHAARTHLVQNDRLATLGTLAAGVAHEINNPAAFILLGLDMLDRLLRGDGVHMDSELAASVSETSRELRDSIRRIVDIARDLRLFASPPDKGRRAMVEVNRTIESALSLTRGQILERAQIVRKLEEVPPVMMDEGRLAQVMVNLLVNAAQAIPVGQGGDHRVTVATHSDGRVVEIEVTDTGLGIPEENLDRIWQPFFSTKEPELGTGLGLSISRDIIQRAGGVIYVESPAGRSEVTGARSGTRFSIVLPAAGHDAEGVLIASPVPRGPVPRARVLVIEDEPALLRALREELGRVHDVRAIESAVRALEVLDTERFDVVLCDLRMPGMSGEALYAEIKRRDPAQAERFIFMTGVGFGAEVERFLESAKRPVLEKPFAADVALSAIERVVKKASQRDSSVNREGSGKQEP